MTAATIRLILVSSLSLSVTVDVMQRNPNVIVEMYKQQSVSDDAFKATFSLQTKVNQIRFFGPYLIFFYHRRDFFKGHFHMWY